MSDPLEGLVVQAKEKFGDAITNIVAAHGELSLEIKRQEVTRVCRALRDDPEFAFAQLIDLCGVDYLTYREEVSAGPRSGPRFAVVYHLLSLRHNRRIRLRAFLDDAL
ncbi:MAG: NADH-quinone oxidoreductase subunit C, partial [Acidiferrobacterales bacterium]